MAFDFPANPVNGQTYQNYVYNSSITAWQQQGTPNNVGVQIAALQTAAPITVANTTARNALYPNPTQGQSVFRTDIGMIETYYGLYNSSTNPGGATPAGWYPERAYGIATRKNNVGYGLGAGFYQNVSSSTYWDSTEVRGGVSDYSNGWTIPFTGIWRVTFNVAGMPTNSVTATGFKINDTTSPGSWSSLYGPVILSASTNSGPGAVVVRKFNAGDVLTMFVYTASAGTWPSETTVDDGRWVIEFIGPAK